jgi:hypothetical protein
MTITEKTKKILSINIRLITLTIRLGLIFIISTLLPPNSAGIFATYSSLLVITSSLVGLDTYNYAIRSLLSNEKAHYRETQINNQIGNILFLGIIFSIPISGIAFYLSKSHETIIIIIFIAHFISETVSQEVCRLLPSVNKQLPANIILLFRTALWIPVSYIILKITFSPTPELILIYTWVTFSIISLFLAIYSLKPHKNRTIKPILNFPALKISIKKVLNFLFLVYF